MKTYIRLILLCFFISFGCGFAAAQEPWLTVVIENPLFSPVSAAKEGVVFSPKTEGINKIKRWLLTITDDSGKKVKEIAGSKSLPERIVWDGTDNSGKIVDDGRYSYEIFVKADKSHMFINNSGIIVDTTLPFVSLKPANDVYFINEEGKISKNINIYLSYGDETGVDYSNSYVKVVSYNGIDVKNFKFNNRIPEFISWDGVDDVYSLPLPLGNFGIIFSVSDISGNRAEVESEISVVQMPKVPEPEKEEEIDVKQEERGLVINLSSKVLFDIGKSNLKEDAEKSLGEVAAILRVYPKNQVSIEGHTDSSGIEKKNVELSVERAQSVFDFFIEQGIARDRIHVSGFGSQKPVASNSTEKGKEQNRRVEIVILKTESVEGAINRNITDSEEAHKVQKNDSSLRDDTGELTEDSTIDGIKEFQETE